MAHRGVFLTSRRPTLRRVKPLVLRMAIADPSAAVAYLGRPCQYLRTEDLLKCDPQLWMRARFSDEAVAAMSLRRR